MSSKRGRKRNDNLPPNRARDVQRAFRARRAAHLVAMEERVAELTEENELLRARLNMPPANRPALGKGPTGKDKPRDWPPRSGEPGGAGSLSRATSSASSTRESSISPGVSNGLHPSPPMGEAQWPTDMLDPSNDSKAGGSAAQSSSSAVPPPSAVSTTFTQQAQGQSYGSPVSPSFAHSAQSGTFSPTASSSAFTLHPVSAPIAQKTQSQPSPYSYSPHMSAGQRPSLSGTVFMQSLPGQGYPQSSYLDSAGSYQPSPISPHDPANHAHSHSSNTSGLQSLVNAPPSGPPFSRRSITEPHAYRALGNHHPYMAGAAAARGSGGDSRLHPVQ